MRRVNLKALDTEGLKAFVTGEGLPLYRAKQLEHWMYERRAESLEDVTELSKPLRESLGRKAYIGNLKLLDKRTASDGTEKFLFGLEDGHSIESVLIPDGERLTLCVSSQAGCAMGCRFCLTGRGGLKRDLSAYEIADQAISVGRLIAPRNLTNIVLMGMGEPLANFDNLAEALRRMTGLMKISRRRITVSTAGILPEVLKLAEAAPGVRLAVSLNATTDEVRSRIMPVNRRYPIKALMDALRKYPLKARERITFEYVLLDGVNDTPEDARRLVRLLKGIPSKVNLIPFNEFEGSEFGRPSDDRLFEFQRILVEGGLVALIRKSKGAEILAACGQLSAGRG